MRLVADGMVKDWDGEGRSFSLRKVERKKRSATLPSEPADSSEDEKQDLLPEPGEAKSHLGKTEIEKAFDEAKRRRKRKGQRDRNTRARAERLHVFGVGDIQDASTSEETSGKRERVGIDWG